MDRDFKDAVRLSNSLAYKLSIPLYEKAIENDKNNFAALNNIAVAKIIVGVEEKKTGYIEEAIKSLHLSIEITKKVFEFEGYPIAEANLQWAQDELRKMK